MSGYSPSERQKIIEEVACKVYEKVYEGASGDGFRDKVMAKTTENLDAILKSTDAKVEIKNLIFKGISSALTDSNYMTPLIFKSTLNMGSISSILENLFKEAVGTSKLSQGKGLNDFLESVKGILDNPPNPDKGGPTESGQKGGAALVAGAAESVAAGAAESVAAGAATSAAESVATSAAESAATSAAESAATSAAESAATTAATGAAEAVEGEAVSALEKEGAGALAKGEGELAKGALTPEDEAEKKQKEDATKMGMEALSSAMKNAKPLSFSSSGDYGDNLGSAAELSSGKYLNDLLKGMDLRSQETQRSILNTINKSLATHLHNSKQEITKSITTITQDCANELSQKMNDQVYTIYVYRALANNFGLLENAIHKWSKQSPEESKDLSIISQGQNVRQIIDFMIQSMGASEFEKQKSETSGGGRVGRSYNKTTIKTRPPIIRRTKHHPFFTRKSNVSEKTRVLNKNNKRFTRKNY